MTRTTDLARGLELVNRWRQLAEKRLEYLDGLYTSGRWRRYHTEQAFLDNIRDAKRAVEAWRLLAEPQTVAAAVEPPGDPEVLQDDPNLSDGAGAGEEEVRAAPPQINPAIAYVAAMKRQPMTSASLLPQLTLGPD